MQKILNTIKKIIPKSVFSFFQPTYHYLLALSGAILYRFPGRKILVIGVTGTKGKTSTVEMLDKVFEAGGKKTALLSTLHFKIDKVDRKNLYKMTMPGRFFVQKFLREAVDNDCEVAIVEMTSEGAVQFRHKFTYLKSLIFLNLAREHIESHGSYENYVQAKVSIAKELEGVNGGTVVVNADDVESVKFLNLNIENKIPYSIKNVTDIKSDENCSSFRLDGVDYKLNIGGKFNIMNALSVIACAKHFGIKEEDIKSGLEGLKQIRGRMEKIDTGPARDGVNQNFEVVVDYAHTPDSLKAIYETYIDKNTICILGNTGGGRDKWKRPEMGKIADEYCDEIILTNEDPYDENPMQILEDMRVGIKNKPHKIILDRREAIRLAITKAKELAHGKPPENKIAVLITGKGTDPYIMGPNGAKEKWDDANVAREELRRIMNKES